MRAQLAANLVPRMDWRSVARPATKNAVLRISLTWRSSVTHMADAMSIAIVIFELKHVRQCCKYIPRPVKNAVR